MTTPVPPESLAADADLCKLFQVLAGQSHVSFATVRAFKKIAMAKDQAALVQLTHDNFPLFSVYESFVDSTYRGDSPATLAALSPCCEKSNATTRISCGATLLRVASANSGVLSCCHHCPGDDKCDQKIHFARRVAAIARIAEHNARIAEQDANPVTAGEFPDASPPIESGELA
jgi:hypothetical protein